MGNTIDFDAPAKKRGRPPKTAEQKAETKRLAEARRREQLQNAKPAMGGLENLEPGDNARFLKHALTIRSWPAINTSDPEEVENRINQYFALCAVDDIKPSVKGFLNSLRIAKSTLWEWKNGGYRAGTHQAIIVEAYNVLEALWEDYMQNGKINPVSGIFLGKNNFGYADKQEYVLTPNTTITPELDVATIEAKYAELPEGDD